MWSLDRQTATIDAGRDAWVVSLSDLSMTVDAGRDVVAWSIGPLDGTAQAGGYAQAAAWDNVLVNIQGDEGAFAWAYGNLNGRVDSSAGFTGSVALGNVDVGMLAGTDAFAVAAGRVNVLTSAGDSAFAWAADELSGHMIAGGTAAALGFADIDLVMNAGRDAIAIAAGDLDGMYTSGRDMGLAAYGDLSTLSEVGRDLVWVWSRGNLEGTYLIGRHVKELFSHGEIYAHVDAATDPSSQIMSVEAIGKIDGQFEAGLSIDHVRSGDAVVATLIAPTVATPIEFDSSLATENPYPDAPTVDLTTVLADAADARDQVLVQKATEVSERDQKLTDHAGERAQTATELTTDRTDTQTKHDQLAADAPGEVATRVAEGEAKFAERRQKAAQEDDAERSSADARLAQAQQEKAEDIADGNAKYQASQAKVAQAVAEADDARYEINVKRGAEFNEMLDRQYEGTNWLAVMGANWKEKINNFFSVVTRRRKGATSAEKRA